MCVHTSGNLGGFSDTMAARRTVRAVLAYLGSSRCLQYCDNLYGILHLLLLSGIEASSFMCILVVSLSISIYFTLTDLRHVTFQRTLQSSINDACAQGDIVLMFTY